MSKRRFSVGRVLAIIIGVAIGTLLHYCVLSSLTLGDEMLILLVLFLFFVIGYFVGRYGSRGRR